MFKLGEIQELKAIKRTEFGLYLSEIDGDTSRKVLLPKTQIPEGVSVDDTISVFLYKDSEDRLIATTTTPKITLDKFAILEVKEVSKLGAFLDWGLTKDLFLPFKEQTYPVKERNLVLVRLYIDKSKRLCASMKVYEHLRKDSPYKKDDKVTGFVYQMMDDFGAFVAVDTQYCALIPTKEIYSKIKVGDHLEARIITITEDGKLTLSLREKSHVAIDKDAYMIYRKLLASKGSLSFNDKSDPERIKSEFNLSKNAFKRAIGRLLKEGKITITDTGIQLTK